MKKIKIIGTIIALAIVLGVLIVFTRPSKIGTTFDDKSEIITTATNEKDKELSGRLVFGHESRTFQLCGNQEVLWISDPKSLLSAKYESLTKNMPPYTEVYAELKGTISDVGDDVDGFASDFDKVLSATEVKVIESLEKHPECIGE